MSDRIFKILFINFALAFMGSCWAENGKQPSRNSTGPETATLRELRMEIGEHMARNEYDRSLARGHELIKKGKVDDDDQMYLTGLVYVAQTHLCLKQFDSMAVYLDRASALALEQGDNWAMATVCNTSGIYKVFTESDYQGGISKFVEGLKYAKQSGDISREFILKTNLALAYYHRDDSSGLEYALDVYRLGHSYGNSYMIFSGAIIAAYFYKLTGDYDRSIVFLEEAGPLTEIYGDQYTLWSIYGDIMFDRGREHEALQYYNRALASEEPYGHFSVVDAHVGYGGYLIGKNQWAEAIGVMEKGIELVDISKNPVKRYLLYRNLSTAYESMGDYRASLRYYKQYHEEADSIFNTAQERAIGQLKVDYEKLRHENEVRQHHVDILNWQKKLQITTFILITVVLITIGGFTLQYRRNKHYRQLLKQHQESVDKERWYEQQIDKMTGGKGVGERYRSRTAPDDKADELFVRLQEVMREEKMYRIHNLNREQVADRLGTNRTYLSQSINKNTGLSFVYYVNSFRIDEAVKMLSDPLDETPIKAIADMVGFSALSSFYKFFQAATGVPPSQFRDNVKSGTGRDS